MITNGRYAATRARSRATCTGGPWNTRTRDNGHHVMLDSGEVVTVRADQAEAVGEERGSRCQGDQT